MKDILLEIRFKNNILLKEIYKNFNSIRQFCFANKLSLVSIYEIINFRRSPITSKLRGKELIFDDLYWTPYALKISKVLDKKPIDLFPENLWQARQNKYTVELDTKDFCIEYNDNLYVENITDNEILDSPKKQRALQISISKILTQLKPREELILRMLFGIDQEKMTQREVAKQFDVTPQRISEISRHAIRKLRHPSRSTVLKEYLTRNELSKI
jgi:RNA polymerase primary sigma factor